MTRSTLSSQADHLALMHALGNLDVQGALLRNKMPLGIQRVALQRDGVLGALVEVSQIQFDRGTLVFSAHGCRARSRCTARTPGVRRTAKQLLKKFAVAFFFAATETRKITSTFRKGKVRIPIRRRLVMTACTHALRIRLSTQLVIGLAFFRIRQHRIGLVDFGHALRRVRFLAYVGMVLAGQFAIGFLDLVCAGILFHAEYLVIVLEFHQQPTPAIRVVLSVASSGAVRLVWTHAARISPWPTAAGHP